MREIRTSGLMSGIWKRGLRYRARSRLYTLGVALPHEWRPQRCSQAERLELSRTDFEAAYPTDA